MLFRSYEGSEAQGHRESCSNILLESVLGPLRTLGVFSDVRQSQSHLFPPLPLLQPLRAAGSRARLFPLPGEPLSTTRWVLSQCMWAGPNPSQCLGRMRQLWTKHPGWTQQHTGGWEELGDCWDSGTSCLAPGTLCCLPSHLFLLPDSQSQIGRAHV